MRKIIFTLLLLINFSCSQPDDQEKPYTVYISTSHCNAEIRIFTAGGYQLGHDTYDCNHVQFCIFKVAERGAYIAHADNGKTKINEPFVVAGPSTSLYLEF